ncbi:hypothetical protein [Pseudomonas purpurea]|uniref:hypothetical protein n=1 Tax=Pseudomonas purpurea TaxID=3136737 RepID=UPI003266B4C9
MFPTTAICFGYRVNINQKSDVAQDGLSDFPTHYLALPVSLDHYKTRDEAQEIAAQFTYDADFEAPEIGRAEGSDLLSLLGLVDIVEARGEQLALTHSGSSYLEKDIASLDELIAVLPSS